MMIRTADHLCSVTVGAIHHNRSCNHARCHPLKNSAVRSVHAVRSRYRDQRKGARTCSCALLQPDAIFTAATVAVMPLYAVMISSPRSDLAQRLLRPAKFFVTVAALYVVLLAAWLPHDVFRICGEIIRSCRPLPDVWKLGAMFESAHITVLAWLHLLLLDLYQAREVWLDGLRGGVFTAHSLVFCFMFGPIGVLSHMMTKAAARWRRKQKTVVMP
ncbi:probable protein ABA DEFICIENT 4, chloroplastic [Coccomyxa sp. Obi]|nr:probable protein ABA DEFICIENT 4, chloroplastic [Coccomyxa sp. Obi]